MQPQLHRHGFSLVELSIVLVILGLLTGGILAGQSLIRASELRAITTEYQRYIAASQTFRDKYFAIPGDFRDATRFWTRQVATADCVTNSSAGVSTPGACDGNGDGSMNAPGAASQSGELFQYWRHLALAGLIEGSYTGIAGASHAYNAVFGTNTPRSKLTNAGYGLHPDAGYLSSHVNHYDGDYTRWMIFGGQTTTLPTAAALKPEEMWNVDTKMDDGRATAGKIVSAKPALMPGCATGAALTDDYNLSNSAIACHIEFRQIF